jgi:hypothetical protein
MSKKIIAGLTCLLILISACKKEQLAPTTALNETVVITDTSMSMTSLKPFVNGTFSSGPFGTVSGKAEIYKQGDKYSLKLSDFSTNNGPALHVYLSKEPMPVTYLDLGELKSTNGNQVYAITGSPDFAEYSYVSIHCVAYNHLFGSARLK